MVMVMMKGNRTNLEIQIHKICETNPNAFQKYKNAVAEILGLKCYLETFWKGAKNLSFGQNPKEQHFFLRIPSLMKNFSLVNFQRLFAKL